MKFKKKFNKIITSIYDYYHQSVKDEFLEYLYQNRVRTMEIYLFLAYFIPAFLVYLFIFYTFLLVNLSIFYLLLLFPAAILFILAIAGYKLITDEINLRIEGLIRIISRRRQWIGPGIVGDVLYPTRIYKYLRRREHTKYEYERLMDFRTFLNKIILNLGPEDISKEEFIMLLKQIKEDLSKNPQYKLDIIISNTAEKLKKSKNYSLLIRNLCNRYGIKQETENIFQLLKQIREKEIEGFSNKVIISSKSILVFLTSNKAGLIILSTIILIILHFLGIDIKPSISIR